MLNTATSYLALLQDEDTHVKSMVLDKIYSLVDEYWAEISDYIPDLEEIYQNNLTPGKSNIVALILSKLYYNLEDYDSSIHWALEAGPIFDITEKSLFVSTILKKIIDKYISIRKDNFFSGNQTQIEAGIEFIVDKIFKNCLETKAYNQAIGFSLESYDLERV